MTDQTKTARPAEEVANTPESTAVSDMQRKRRRLTRYTVLSNRASFNSVVPDHGAQSGDAAL